MILTDQQFYVLKNSVSIDPLCRFEIQKHNKCLLMQSSYNIYQILVIYYYMLVNVKLYPMIVRQACHSFHAQQIQCEDMNSHKSSSISFLSLPGSFPIKHIKHYFSEFKYQNVRKAILQQESLSQEQNNKSKKFIKEKVRDKYVNDYLYFKSIPFDIRGQQLERILMVPPTQDQFQGAFKENHKCRQEWFECQSNKVKYKLKAYIWEPKNQSPKAVLVSYHSLNGHSLKIASLAQNLTKKGYVVAAIDYPNFGQSQGQKRGNIPSFSYIAEPCQKFFYHIRKQYQNTKIYMMGRSLGGAVAFSLSNRLSNKELDGLILLSPALRQNPYHLPFKKKIGLFLSLVLPNFRMPKLKTRQGCKYKLDQYLKTDPYLYRQGMWSYTLWTVISAMMTFSKQFKHLDKPYLIVQSGLDKLVDPFLAIDLQTVSPSKDKTTVMIHDMWHNIWFDDKKEDVMKIVEEWLQERNP